MTSAGLPPPVGSDIFLPLAQQGARLPIGTELVLSEKPNHAAIKLDGSALGKVIVEAAQRWKSPLGFPLMDLAVEKQCLGLALGIPESAIPTWHFDGPAPDALPPLPLTPRLLANCNALRHVAQNSSLVPIGMSIGPFSFMTKLVSDPITPVFSACLGDTDDEDVQRLEQLLNLAEQLLCQTLDQQMDAGAKAIVVCEPAANTTYFSPNQLDESLDTFDRYVTQPNTRLAQRLQKRGVALIFHDCGELTPALVQRFAGLRPAMMSLGSSRLLWEDAPLVPMDTVLYGNLPTKTFYSDETMPLEKVRSLARDLLSRMQATGHPFILGSECDVLSVAGSEKTIRDKVKAFLDI